MEGDPNESNSESQSISNQMCNKCLWLGRKRIENIRKLKFSKAMGGQADVQTIFSMLAPRFGIYF